MANPVRPQPKATPPKKKEGLDARLGGGIAVLVMGLAALVWWSLPDEGKQPEVVISTEAGAVPTDFEGPEAGVPLTKIDRPPRAFGELMILTAKPEDEIRRLATPDEIAKHLEARHCGTSCDLVKKMLSEEDAFTVDVRSAEDVMLPSKDMLDTFAFGLTPTERDGIADRKQALLVDVDGAITTDQRSARTLLSSAAALAEMLDGVVYDETERRIFGKDEMLAMVIKTPVGQPVFKPQQIAVQLFRQDDGTERLTSLGLQRFGAPDLTIRGGNMSTGPLLANVLNAAAAQLVLGKNDLPFTITLADIAAVTGADPANLNANAAGARAVTLEAVEPEHDPSDPENDVIELQPPRGGASRDAWDEVIADLYGAPPWSNIAPDDKELGDVAKKTRTSLPDAVTQWKNGAGLLFVKGPFPIPRDERPDGGEGANQLWIQTASCDAKLCTGTYTNEPSYPSNIAPGKTVSVNRAEALDWMIRQRDGGVTGGESIKLLSARAKK